MVDEERVNLLLDTILDFKSSLKIKTNKIYEVNERIEKITWFNNLDDESLMLLNDLISSAKDLRTSLIRQYLSMNFLRKRGLPNRRLKILKTQSMN